MPITTTQTTTTQDERTNENLFHALALASQKVKVSGKKAFSCKQSTFPIANSEYSVQSWRFQDWDYKRDDLPTYARGLFTYRTKQGKPEIAIRGYDKFFNVEEVNSTRWRNIENNTKGPYELSVKENGCIIFMSGLEDGTLLVCSKHSTGMRQDTDKSHAVAGERWVEKHLASVGKTSADLAKELRRLNITAVAELCDDSFEEHVLAYDEKYAGLYLHGLNANLPEFVTYTGKQVHEFADTWGFKKAEFETINDLADVKKLLDKCAETGSYKGRDTEGFVIRCQTNFGNGPYVDWFFKYKFEEPYLMYRQWRECTKSVISGKSPKMKKHKQITEQYLLYAKRQLASNPAIAKAYNQNHGIIAMRDGFLAERGLKGSDIIRQEQESGEADTSGPVTRDVLLCPVASIGCGKTTLALALTKLFGWGHFQNDNVQGKGNRPKRFVTELTHRMALHPAVIADRNNHQKRERKQLIDDVSAMIPDTKFVALHYVHDPKSEKLPKIREVTRRRVLDRGDNHQTIHAGSKGETEITGIMEGFLNRFEPVNVFNEPDDGFDHVIDMDPTADSRENLEVVVESLHDKYPKLVPNVPSPEELDKAIDAAMKDYSVDVKHDLSFGKDRSNGMPNRGRNSEPPSHLQKSPEQMEKLLEYFGITLPANDVTSTLSSLFASTTDPNISRLYNQLTQSRRVQPSFHVTLIHRAESKSMSGIWDQYCSAYKNRLASDPSNRDPLIGAARIRLERLVWNDRVMAFVARIMPPASDPNAKESWPCSKEIAHVTVGTASAEIKPKESNDLLQKWLKEGVGAETGIFETEVPGMKVLDGQVKAVLQRGK